MTDESTSIDQLYKNLDHAMISDRHRLRRQLHDLRKKPDEAKLAQWVERVQASFAQVTSRRQSVPVIRYDENLPIAAKRDEIKDALLKHQVLIIAGETGSGKTTQLPKICLEIGRGTARPDRAHPAAPDRCTQRRQRVAEELGTPLGDAGRLSGALRRPQRQNTLIKLMTDGILLAEPSATAFSKLRHDHHRRSPRAQPQHRLPARLPENPAAAPART
jgi:ATP-dependent helicase HrpA